MRRPRMRRTGTAQQGSRGGPRTPVPPDPEMIRLRMRREASGAGPWITA
jgi:hypothetical protein